MGKFPGIEKRSTFFFPNKHKNSPMTVFPIGDSPLQHDIISLVLRIELCSFKILMLNP